MGLTNTAKNTGLDAITPLLDYASLHSANPGTSGANEISGGSPAYARKAITWGAAASGAVTLTAPVTFDVGAGTTVTHFGLWSAVSGGTFYGGFAIASEPEIGGGHYMPFTANDTANDTFWVYNSPLDDGDAVVLIDAGLDAALPSGVTEGTIYYVRDEVPGVSFKLAATPGGSVIDLGGPGSGMIVMVHPAVFSAQGELDLNINLNLNAVT